RSTTWTLWLPRGMGPTHGVSPTTSSPSSMTVAPRGILSIVTWTVADCGCFGARGAVVSPRLMDPIGAVGCAASARAELGGVAGGPGSAAGGAGGASTVGGDAGGGDAGCAGGWGGRDDTVGGALGVAVSVGDEAAAAVGGDTGSD